MSIRAILHDNDMDLVRVLVAREGPLDVIYPVQRRRVDNLSTRRITPNVANDREPAVQGDFNTTVEEQIFVFHFPMCLV